MGVNLIGSEQRDRLTLAPLSISTDHNYIHRGKAFTISGKTASVAAGAQHVIRFTTPADKYIHLRPTSWATTANLGEFRIAQGSTTSGGSAVTAYNRNHLSSLTPSATIIGGATMTVEGTIKLYDSCGIGGTSTRAGGAAGGEDNEIVLAPSTVYTFTFANVGATTATVFYFNLFWYEEDEGLINGS
jgi:hypothetical protein